MNVVYVEAFRSRDGLTCSFESVLTLYVCELCEFRNVCVRILLVDAKSTENFTIPEPCKVEYVETVPKIATYCKWPVVVSGRTVIAGLCSTLRQIIKVSDCADVVKLLGFRQACLVACSESSIWTKFCEVDVVNTVKELFKDRTKFFNDNGVIIPTDVSRFEQHMAQPVRIHNVYKLARVTSGDKSIKSSTPVEELNLKHEFSEGPFISLSDVILYVCFYAIFNTYGLNFAEKHLPLTHTWFQNMQLQNLPEITILLPPKPEITSTRVLKTSVAPQSLYVADPKRFRPQSRSFTKQTDIENSLNLVKISISNARKPFESETHIDWSEIPLEINPTGGALPAKRALRKREQLESLLKPVVRLARAGDTIVDFCSGSGHLGLLIAATLPECNVVLVENKEMSLVRARERVEKLQLTNVVLLQCNLDYFGSMFEVGVSLHACGVATDLVMQTCIENRAHFVCCPCCYGGVHDCLHLKYPRSDVFRRSDLRYKDYLNLVHAADQTHGEDNVKTKQGFFCMDVVDTDRKLYAEQFGYEIFLGKLQPVTCTPKNNLLVGVYKRM